MREEIQKAFDNVLDTMTGSDGCGRFVMFMSLIKNLDKQAENGDQKAEEVLMFLKRFSRLIDVAQMKEGK